MDIPLILTVAERTLHDEPQAVKFLSRNLIS